MKIAILGYGREGKSALKLLKKSRLLRGVKFSILDKKLNKNYLRNLEQFDVIIRSPGVPYNLPELRSARQNGVLFSSATKIFFNNCRGAIVGITGTKGKGTTSTLLYNILKSAHKNVFLAGNIGKSPLEILPKLRKESIVILELSSFQLQDLIVSPKIAVVLDVFPDHQDSHLDLKEYYSAKTNIARYQKKNDKIFFFKNNGMSRRVASKSRGRKIAVDDKKFRLFKPEDLKIRGYHNFKNAVMAGIVARELGVPKKTIISAAKKFRGMEHRLEFVRKIEGVSFYNDSASTNPQTSAAAIKSFPDETKILIVGGQDKGLNYKPLSESLKNPLISLVILFGENKGKIKKTIIKSGVPIKIVSDLKSAIKTAYEVTGNGKANVIFSPGAASFDMFKNYADRGNKFKKLVKKLRAR